MKCLLLLTAFLFPASMFPGSVYYLGFVNADGIPINMSYFYQKKIVIVEFNSLQPDTLQLIHLDSLQRANPDSLGVIAVPALEFSDSVSIESIQSLRDSLGLSLMFTYPAYVKKTSVALQHSLFQWLTDATKNDHFDDDVVNPGELFILGKQGTLYSRLSSNPPDSVLNAILAQPIDE